MGDLRLRGRRGGADWEWTRTREFRRVLLTKWRNVARKKLDPFRSRARFIGLIAPSASTARSSVRSYPITVRYGGVNHVVRRDPKTEHAPINSGKHLGSCRCFFFPERLQEEHYASEAGAGLIAVRSRRATRRLHSPAAILDPRSSARSPGLAQPAGTGPLQTPHVRARGGH